MLDGKEGRVVVVADKTKGKKRSLKVGREAEIYSDEKVRKLGTGRTSCALSKSSKKFSALMSTIGRSDGGEESDVVWQSGIEPRYCLTEEQGRSVAKMAPARTDGMHKPSAVRPPSVRIMLK